VTSRVETGASTRRGCSPGAAIISGTRAEPSKKLILNHNPRSPSMSPWSETKTTMVSSAIRQRFNTSMIPPIFASRYEILAK
jgi:hypothetical protein